MASPANHPPESWPRTSHDATEDNSSPLRVAIIGAGIGGLSAAIGLRRAGHEVTLYEQSRSTTEVGAAIHLAPNSNGILRRWSIYPENLGANTMSYLREFTFDGRLIREMDLKEPNKRWQHPWHLVHRVALHDKLRSVATSTDGLGRPASLHNSSRVVNVDPEKGVVELENGKLVSAHVIIGADGIYSKLRRYVNDGNDPALFGSGKAAYRCMIPREVAESDPETAILADKPDALKMWFGDDRRVVMYPCNNNADLNFVLIHPDNESHATWSKSWNKAGSVEQCLKVFQHFDPAVKKLLSKVDPPILMVWQLLDMNPLETWTAGKLALLGDAAHPFTPYQGQGGAQAIEDAAALSVVFPLGTRPDEVPGRLKLYDKIRRTRAHTIQQYSRLAGKDASWADGKLKLDMMQFTNYNFGHDEYDYARNIFRRWQWSRNPKLAALVPTPYGPFPPSRKSSQPPPPTGESTQHLTTASITFKSSRTLLETLFPTASFRFIKANTVCLATLVLCRRRHGSWPDGRECCSLGLYFHGVEYTQKDGSKLSGPYLAVLFESVAAPLVSSGDDEVSLPKVLCDIGVTVTTPTSSFGLTLSEIGTVFCKVEVSNLESSTIPPNGDRAEAAELLACTYSPPADDLGRSDGEFGCIAVSLDRVSPTPKAVERIFKSKDASVKFAPKIRQDQHPVLHHLATTLAEMPVYEILECKVVEGMGVLSPATSRAVV